MLKGLEGVNQACGGGGPLMSVGMSEVNMSDIQRKEDLEQFLEICSRGLQELERMDVIELRQVR